MLHWVTNVIRVRTETSTASNMGAYKCCGGTDETPQQHTQDCDRLIEAKEIAWSKLDKPTKMEYLERARKNLLLYKR